MYEIKNQHLKSFAEYIYSITNYQHAIEYVNEIHSSQIEKLTKNYIFGFF